MVEQVSSLKTGIKYKNTPIGKIPVDWEVVKLGTVSDLKNGINFKKEQKGDAGILTVDVLNMYSIDIFVDPTNLYRVNIDLDSKEEYILKRGDILFVRSSLKKEGVGWASLFKPFNEPATFCGFIIRGRLISTKIIPEFLIYFLRSDRVRERLISGAGQVAITNISQETLQNLEIVVPPPPEQKKIAVILTTLDEEIEKTAQIIGKTKEVKKGLMQRLLTRGVGHEKFKKTEIGEIPEEWNIGKISDYGEIVTGSTPSTNVPEYYGTEYPFISPFDLGSKKIIIKSQKYLSEKGLCVSRKVPPNSVLVVCIGSTIGKTGVAGNISATNQQINSIICKNNEYNFVYYYVTFISDKIRQLAGTQAVPIINKGNFSMIRAAIPPIGEQKMIGDILSSIDEEVEKETNHKEHLELLKKGVMQVLLTGKVRVSI
jgi:type I restriction enzyme, S subunit